MPGAEPASPPLRLRTGLAAVTASSVVLGLAEVTAPVLWWLVPVGVCTRVRARVGLLVGAWAAALMAGFFAVPFVPGPQGDAASFLLLAGALLAVIGGVWWQTGPGVAEVRVAACDAASSPEGPEVAQAHAELLSAGHARAVVCPGRDPAQLAVHVSTGEALRVLVGELQGELASVQLARAAVVSAVRHTGARPETDLVGVARAVDAALAAAAGGAHLSAALVEVAVKGEVRLLGCGGPPPVFALLDGPAVEELPAAGWPLGCGRVEDVVVPVAGPGLLAVVSDAVPRSFLCSGMADRARVAAMAELLRERSSQVKLVSVASVLAHLPGEGGEGTEAAVLVLAVPPPGLRAGEELFFLD